MRKKRRSLKVRDYVINLWCYVDLTGFLRGKKLYMYIYFFMRITLTITNLFFLFLHTKANKVIVKMTSRIPQFKVNAYTCIYTTVETKYYPKLWWLDIIHQKMHTKYQEEVHLIKQEPSSLLTHSCRVKK